MTMTREEAKHHLKRIGEKVGQLALMRRRVEELDYQIKSLEAWLRDMQSKAADAAAVLSSEAP